MYEYLFHLYVMAIGFCAAGLCMSGFKLATGHPLRFGLQIEKTGPAIFGVFTRVLAGPAIVMRNAIRGAAIEGRAPVWLILSTFISMLWSFFSGVVMLELLYAL